MSILFCEFSVECNKKWDSLKETDIKLVRDCDDCGKAVHFITNQSQLEEAAMEGKCVAYYENISMPQSLVEQLLRIRELNKHSVITGKKMRMGLPSSK